MKEWVGGYKDLDNEPVVSFFFSLKRGDMFYFVDGDKRKTLSIFVSILDIDRENNFITISEKWFDPLNNILRDFDDGYLYSFRVRERLERV